MGFLRMDLRAFLRKRGSSVVGLALVIAIAGALVLTAASGARRSATAYDRFVAAHPPADVFLPNPSFGGDFGAIVLDPAEVKTHPDVAAISVGRVAISEAGPSFAPFDDHFGAQVPQWKVIEGRVYDPQRRDEAVAFWNHAESRGLAVGDKIRYPGQAPEDAPPACRNIKERHQMDVTIVGIVAAPGPFFSAGGEAQWSLALSPALSKYLPTLAQETGCEFLAFPPTTGAMWVRAEPGRLNALLSDLETGKAGSFLISEAQDAYHERNRESIRLQAIALGILAAASGLAMLLVVGQAVARQVRMQSFDAPTFRALGAGRGQLIASGLFRAGIPALIGTTIAVVGAYFASALTPFGAARIAEPQGGIWFDSTVLVGGGTAMFAVLVMAALPAVIAGSRASRNLAQLEQHAKESMLARGARKFGGLGPERAVGIGMAFDPGRGRTAVPVRSTIVAVSMGTAVLVASLVFASSIGNLIRSPATYGAKVEAWIHNDPEGFPFADYVSEVRADPDVAGAMLGTPGGVVRVDGQVVEVMPLTPIFGDVAPDLLAGQQPQLADEIMLGKLTADGLGVTVGDEVAIDVMNSSGSEKRVMRMRVVGIGVIPPFERAGFGKGAVVTPEGIGSLMEGGDTTADGMFVALREGSDQEEVLARLKERIASSAREKDGFEGELEHFGFAPPSDVVNFGKVESLPAILAGIISLIGIATLAHLTVTGVRRRRPDLALLKVLGFEKRQVRSAVRWQSISIVLIGLAIGIPLGIGAGRWLWIAFVERLGLVPYPVIPAGIALVAPGAILVAVAVAVGPAIAASRTIPAVALRAE